MLKKLYTFFQQHLRTSRTEFNGLIIFIPTLLMIVSAPSLLKSYLLTSVPDTSEHQQLLDEWYSQSMRQQYVDKETVTQYIDPNQIAVHEWVSLGFRPEIAQRIANYRLKGGKFYKLDDLLRIYGISERLVYYYEPQFIFAKRPKYTAGEKFSNKLSQVVQAEKESGRVSVELPKAHIRSAFNLADTTALRRVKGIGPVLSRRIVNYRSLIGGFYCAAQLSEVYGLKPEVIERILNNFDLAGDHLVKIQINAVDADHLSLHPYIDKRTARQIEHYRTQHGHFTSVEDLKMIHTLGDTLISRLMPYLDFSPVQ